MNLGAYNTITKYGGNRETRGCLRRRDLRRNMPVSCNLSDSVHLVMTPPAVSELCPWDRPVATLQTSGHPLSLAFHAYDPHLVVANESDTIRYTLPRRCLMGLIGSYQRLGLDSQEAAKLFL